MPQDVPPGQPDVSEFRQLAERFAGGEIVKKRLSTFLLGLPILTHAHLDTLAAQAEALAHINPRLGWSLAAVAEAAAQLQTSNLRLQAEAAWYLARAANRYFSPQYAAHALHRAETAFQQLGDEVWLAACKWQRNFLPWARPDLLKCEAEVKEVLKLFSRTDSSLAGYREECRLTLAYIQALIGRFPDSLENLAVSEKVFAARKDRLNFLRALLIKANVLLRQSKFDEAISELEDCLQLGEVIAAPVEVALSQMQLGSVLSKRHRKPGGYQEAEMALLEAAGRFAVLDLSFWEALCRDGLAIIYISTGRLSDADVALDYCRRVFREYNVDAPLAQVLTNSGWLETYRANYEQGLAYLVESEKLCRQVGNLSMVGGCYMHLGEIYIEMGRYQQALRYLEQSSEVFHNLKSYARAAESGLRLARCWVYLGRSSPALETLKQVEEYAKKSKQNSIFPYLYIRRAEALSLEGRLQETVSALRAAVKIANKVKDDTGAALARRLLGETLCELGLLAEAADNIKLAEEMFTEIGLLVEQAACRLVWGQYFRKMDDAGAARKSYQEALGTGKELAPDIVWQAHAGLAALAEDAGSKSKALSHYRQMVRALVRLRQDIWQPALAGYFLARPVTILERAVRLAVDAGSADDVLEFIEAGKAQALANLFQRPISVSSTKQPPELANLVAEIRWRQERIRGLSGGVGWLQTADLRQMRQKIKELVKQYDSLRSQMERKNRQVVHALLPAEHEFDLARFREAADKSFGKNWLALDYFFTDDNLTCVLIDGRRCELINAAHPGYIRMMFDGLGSFHAAGQWQSRELKALGDWLLPDVVKDELTPDTVLIIVPHTRLHSLPWSALTAGGRPLVEKAVPIVVPSLQSLSVLMDRPYEDAPGDSGLLLAVSDFGERHGALPQTTGEVNSLWRLYPESKCLVDEEATWHAILALAEESGLDNYSFLHIASHGFPDAVSGRLSGLALYDRDVWLDELWDCAPFPPLVTLSACSGSQSKLYEGDEQVGLATTCLAAGARQVVASLWPIHDEEAAVLMINFYTCLLRGDGAAHALAQAQRTAVWEGKDVVHWAGFRCTGLPN